MCSLTHLSQNGQAPTGATPYSVEIVKVSYDQLRRCADLGSSPEDLLHLLLRRAFARRTRVLTMVFHGLSRVAGDRSPSGGVDPACLHFEMYLCWLYSTSPGTNTYFQRLTCFLPCTHSMRGVGPTFVKKQTYQRKTINLDISTKQSKHVFVLRNPSRGGNYRPRSSHPLTWPTHPARLQKRT